MGPDMRVNLWIILSKVVERTSMLIRPSTRASFLQERDMVMVNSSHQLTMARSMKGCMPLIKKVVLANVLKMAALIKVSG